MSIRPIDIITMAPKSQEVSQLQQADQTRMQHNQDSAATMFQTQVKQSTEQTTKMKETNEEWNLPEKDKKGGGGKKQHKKKDGEPEDNKENLGQMGFGSSFDMKI